MAVLSPFKALIFDFDGTLAFPSLNLQKMSSVTENAVRKLLPQAPPRESLPILEWLDLIKQTILPCYMDNSRNILEELEQCANSAMISIELEAARTGALFPYTKYILTKLKEKGIKTGIITRNCRDAVQTLFPDYSAYCDCLLSRDDVAAVKPNPLHLLTALNIIQVSPDKALMVGDHPMDIETGKKANSYTAGVYSGHASIDELKQTNPDFLAKNCLQLLTVLEEQQLIP